MTGPFAQRLVALVGVAMLLALSGCAALPERSAVRESHAVPDTGGTPLARIASSAAVGHDGLSGFRLLPQGEFAFNARLALARRAVATLDVQYYEIRADEIGLRLLRELRDAAARGVRVRILVDDLYAAGEDELFIGLAAHPNVELRIFNPLPWRDGGYTTRLLLSLGEFGRINHRMHNKLFVADNAFAVSGGRNIAREYFMQDDGANFVDLDVLSTGAVVAELSGVFDRYWNSARAYPIEQVASRPSRRLSAAAARAGFDALVRDAPDLPEPATDVLGHLPVAQALDEGRLQQVFATARVFADPPMKVRGTTDPSAEGATVGAQTLALFAAAKRSVQMISPYFIAGERGMSLMRQGIADGGEVELITNSFASTDEPLVYAGYARYRLPMLQAGVRIYELGPALSSRFGKLGDFRRSLGRLHVKSALIDDRLLFIGSMNMDPRSANANTEAGMFIDSPELIAARNGAAALRDLLKSSAYELRLTADRQGIVWVEHRPDGTTVVHTQEPGLSAWQRVKLQLLTKLVDEALL